LDHLDKASGVRAAVLISNKAEGFIAGADINMLAACKTSKELSEVRAIFLECQVGCVVHGIMFLIHLCDSALAQWPQDDGSH